jgi:hypothetical protein
VALPPGNEGARRAPRTLSAHAVAGLERGPKSTLRAASRLARSGARGLSARACRPAATVARRAHAPHRHPSRLRYGLRGGSSLLVPRWLRAPRVRAAWPSNRTHRAGSPLPRQRSRSRSGRVPDGSSIVAGGPWSDFHGAGRGYGESSPLAAGRSQPGSTRRRCSSDPGSCSRGSTPWAAAITRSSTPPPWAFANMQLCGPGCVWSGPERPSASPLSGPVRLRPEISEDRHNRGGPGRPATLNFSRVPESIRSRRSGLLTWSRGRA